jgi:DNA polymerase III subunit gamma/tau
VAGALKTKGIYIMSEGTKYRPITFDDVLGLDNIKDILKATLKKGQYEPAYLFIGEYSSGKTTLGRIFARSILCSNRKEDGSPCNECQSCRDFLEERSSSYTEVDAATNSTKEKIQELLEALTYETVTEKRVILLDECHAISSSGKDALLLQLEKNNSNVVFIFCTTVGDKVPPQLKSRCCEFQIPLPTEVNIQKKLEYICKLNSYNYTPDALYSIIQATGRHYRDAEIKLGLASLLGDINDENVSKVVTTCTKEIAFLLSTLPYDLTKVFKAVEYLTSRMNIKDIYENILRMLNDTLKYTKGIIPESTTYAEALKILSVQYGQTLYEVIDYILAKNRLTDLTVFQADILVLHYKMSKNDFVPKNTTTNPTPTKKEEKQAQKVETKSAITLEEIYNLPPWEKEEKIRELKNSKLKENKNNEIVEKVTEKWGPEYTQSPAANRALLREPSKTKISALKVAGK